MNGVNLMVFGRALPPWEISGRRHRRGGCRWQRGGEGEDRVKREKERKR